MKYFVFATFLSFFASSVYGQDFFIPKGAMMPVQDNLKPLDDTLTEHMNTYSERRYIIRDGRVIAVENEIVEEEIPTQEAQNVADDTPQRENIQVPEQEPLPAPIQNSSLKETAPRQPFVEAPQTDAVDHALPAYKNRYAFYLEDLKTFRKTGKMPQNPDLQKMLEDLSSPQSETLFDAVLR